MTLTMAQQTQIDQYFKSTSGKQTLNSVIRTKTNSRLKSIPYIKNRNKNGDKKKSIPSQHSIHLDSELDCAIIYERINNTCYENANKVKILLKDEEKMEANENNEVSYYKNEYTKDSSQEMTDYQNESFPVIGKLNSIDTKVLNNDNMGLKILQKEIETSSVNEGTSQINVKLKETINKELGELRKNNSSSNDNSSVPNHDDNFYLNDKSSKDWKICDNKNVQTENFNDPTFSPKRSKYSPKVSSPKKSNYSPKLSSPKKSNYSPNVSSPKKSNYSPKVSSPKSVRNIPARKLFSYTINDGIIMQVIEFMNLAKQNAIPLNNFNLETIYSKDTFDYKYNDIDAKTSIKYEFNEITKTTDLKSNILITTIFTVLSNPINCGYFNQNELDTIYSILTLPVKAQMLLSRMITRKRTWHRKTNIKYETEIAADLKSIFEILVAKSICTFDIENEHLSNILELLQGEELRRLCQNMKIDSNGKKENHITKLIKLSKKNSLFPGRKSPRSALYSCIFNILDYCVRISDNTWSIVDRMLTLLIPNEDPKKSTADIFFMLFDIYQGNVIFPEYSENHFPIFSSRLHLLSYVEAKSKLFEVLVCMEKKDWVKIQEYGNLAMDILPNVLNVESLRLKNSTLPMHVRRFMPGYIWLKILSKSIDAFKKNKDKKRVVEILKYLIDQDCHMHTRKGEWYNELALIEMFHLKNLEASAMIIMKALENENLSRVHKIELIERGNKILQRKAGLQLPIKIQMNKVLDDHAHQMPKHEAKTNIIHASLMPMNTAGNKSVWCVENSTDGQSYGSVENLALYHYYKHEFSEGLHCEGALPILLFVTVFWEELYQMHVPGGFVTSYQKAPEDLFTENFYENRKEKIDMKLQVVDNFDSESFSNWMERKFEKYRHYESIMPVNLLKNTSHIKEISYCLGVEGVIGICKRMIDNFQFWKAGFPDLIVWNVDTKQHKIVEVKGPNDILSTKQRLWLEYLNQLGLNTEVCLIQDSAKRSRKK